MSERVGIIGDGQMALAIADALYERGLNVRMWGPIGDDVRTLASTRKSPRLEGFTLNDSVEVTDDDSLAFNDADVVVSAIPTQFLRSVWTRLEKYAPRDVPVVSVTKGIENDTLLRPTEVIAQVLASKGSGESDVWQNLCVLSGPSIAAELVRHLPATMIAAAENDKLAQWVQDILNVSWLRVYRLDDIIGVELSAATKNVIALAAGMVDGLRLGANAKSALLARGLAEIARLGLVMGARLDTFFGVAGVGDLATTCFSPEGRNRTCGERLAKGESLDQVLSSMSSIVEGVATTKSVVALAKRFGVEMPITASVHAILFEGLSPKDAIRDLMSRELKPEQVG